MVKATKRASARADDNISYAGRFIGTLIVATSIVIILALVSGASFDNAILLVLIYYFIGTFAPVISSIVALILTKRKKKLKRTILVPLSLITIFSVASSIGWIINSSGLSNNYVSESHMQFCYYSVILLVIFLVNFARSNTPNRYTPLLWVTAGVFAINALLSFY